MLFRSRRSRRRRRRRREREGAHPGCGHDDACDATRDVSSACSSRNVVGAAAGRDRSMIFHEGSGEGRRPELSFGAKIRQLGFAVSYFGTNARRYTGARTMITFSTGETPRRTKMRKISLFPTRRLRRAGGGVTAGLATAIGTALAIGLPTPAQIGRAHV